VRLLMERLIGMRGAKARMSRRIGIPARSAAIRRSAVTTDVTHDEVEVNLRNWYHEDSRETVRTRWNNPFAQGKD